MIENERYKSTDFKAWKPNYTVTDAVSELMDLGFELHEIITSEMNSDLIYSFETTNNAIEKMMRVI